jgi:hypothetical protein
MKDQMDQTRRPKMVMMEAGGNDAIFYPMADACLFKSNRTRTCRPKYEEDNDPNNLQGECRKEIREVRKRVTGNFIYNKVVETIDIWRAHPAVFGNDASFFLLGYAKFFADSYDPACDNCNFGVFYSNEVSNVLA